MRRFAVLLVLLVRLSGIGCLLYGGGAAVYEGRAQIKDMIPKIKQLIQTLQKAGDFMALEDDQETSVQKAEKDVASLKKTKAGRGEKAKDAKADDLYAYIKGGKKDEKKQEEEKVEETPDATMASAGNSLWDKSSLGSSGPGFGVSGSFGGDGDGADMDMGGLLGGAGGGMDAMQKQMQAATGGAGAGAGASAGGPAVKSRMGRSASKSFSRGSKLRNAGPQTSARAALKTSAGTAFTRSGEAQEQKYRTSAGFGELGGSNEKVNSPFANVGSLGEGAGYGDAPTFDPNDMPVPDPCALGSSDPGCGEQPDREKPSDYNDKVGLFCKLALALAVAGMVAMYVMDATTGPYRAIAAAVWLIVAAVMLAIMWSILSDLRGMGDDKPIAQGIATSLMGIFIPMAIAVPFVLLGSLASGKLAALFGTLSGGLVTGGMQAGMQLASPQKDPEVPSTGQPPPT